jgi:beta-xylosidase
LIFIFCSCFLQGICQTSEKLLSADSSIIHLADPTILYYNNKYYLYGTVEGNSGNGFLVYVSTKRKQWVLSDLNNGFALKKGDGFGTAGFWAPQVFFHNKKFYMAYTANENIAIAESDNPVGPFQQVIKQQLQAPVKQIDPFVFINDGKVYLYHVRLTNGNRIFVAEMTEDLSAIKQETLRECITATETWENTANAKWPVAEGPSVLKHKGVYYLFYSANDFRNPDYAVGYATSNDPLGPWTKHTGNPILNKQLINASGPGHGDFLKAKNHLYYVFHTHTSHTKVAPRKTALLRARFKKKKNTAMDNVEMNQKSFYFLRK